MTKLLLDNALLMREITLEGKMVLAPTDSLGFIPPRQKLADIIQALLSFYNAVSEDQIQGHNSLMAKLRGKDL